MQRIIKFGFVGATSAVIQLAFLTILVTMFHLNGRLIANAVNVFAFFFSAQVNFVLSRNITWCDRRVAFRFRHLLDWNSMILVAFGLNQGAFALANIWVQPVAAGIIGILVGSGVNYLAQSTLIFRRP